MMNHQEKNTKKKVNIIINNLKIEISNNNIPCGNTHTDESIPTEIVPERFKNKVIKLRDNFYWGNGCPITNNTFYYLPENPEEILRTGEKGELIMCKYDDLDEYIKEHNI